MNRQIVVLETEEGTARSKKHLERVWNLRIKKYFSHYKLISVAIVKKGKK